jgi:hypothetical protein
MSSVFVITNRNVLRKKKIHFYIFMCLKRFENFARCYSCSVFKVRQYIIFFFLIFVTLNFSSQNNVYAWAYEHTWTVRYCRDSSNTKNVIKGVYLFAEKEFYNWIIITIISCLFGKQSKLFMRSSTPPRGNSWPRTMFRRSSTPPRGNSFDCLPKRHEIAVYYPIYGPITSIKL